MRQLLVASARSHAGFAIALVFASLLLVLWLGYLLSGFAVLGALASLATLICALLPIVVTAYRSGYAASFLFVCVVFAVTVLGLFQFLAMGHDQDPPFGLSGSSLLPMTPMNVIRVYWPMMMLGMVVSAGSWLLSRRATEPTGGSIWSAGFWRREYERHSPWGGNQKGRNIEWIGWAAIAVCAIGALWMRTKGIGITGFNGGEPLPWHFAGIATYGYRLALPLAVMWVYGRSSRGNLATVAVLLLGFGLACLQLSRGTVAIYCLVVAVFSLLDRRWVRLGATAVFAWLAVSFVTLLRGAEYALLYAIPADITKTSFLASWKPYLVELYWLPDWSVLDPILRIEPAVSFLKSAVLDLSSLGGASNRALAFVWDGLYWDSVSADAWHMAWLGTTLQDGFYEGPSTLGNVSLLAHNSVLIGFAVCLLVLVSLMLAEALGRAVASVSAKGELGILTVALLVVSILLSLGSLHTLYLFLLVGMGVFLLRGHHWFRTRAKSGATPVPGGSQCEKPEERDGLE